MGGGGVPQPNIIGGGQTPIQVPPFGSQPQMPNPFFVPGQSMKGGGLQGLPSLQDTFNRPLGGAPLFPNSQSFPQAPIVPPWTTGLIQPILMPQGPGGVIGQLPMPQLPRIIPDVPAPAPVAAQAPTPQRVERDIER